MAESVYLEYIKQFGYPPKNASHLSKFAKQNGQSLSWKDASNLIKNPPNVSESKQETSQTKFDQKQTSSTIQHNNNSQLEIRVNYNNQTYKITVNQQINKYTVADLRKEIIEKYISEPASSLIFKFESSPIYNFKKNIVSYFKDRKNQNVITFDVELWGINKHNLKAKESTHKKIVRSQGINKKKLINEIKKQFHGAYFTDYNQDDEKIQNNSGKWDKNLNEGISTIISSEQNKLYNDVVKIFDKKISQKLQEHKQIENKIQTNPNNKSLIQQQLDAMINKRKTKINNEYQKKLRKMKENQIKMNNSWEHTQKETLKYYNGDESVKKKIEKERIQRKIYQQKQMESHQRFHTLQQLEIDELHKQQKSKLQSTNDVQQWHTQFEMNEIKKEKRNSLKELVKNKIESTNSQVTFAKYLNNSPFADNLAEEARKSDHEITKIAKLAEETLFVDMVNTDINNDTDESDDEKEKEPYLEFELRLDAEYHKFDASKQQKLLKDFAKLTGINVNDLELISTREGSWIGKLKAKAKAIVAGMRDGIGRGINAGAKGLAEMKEQLLDMDKKLYKSNSELELTKSLNYMKAKLGGENNIDKETFYMEQQCVLIIVSNHKEKKSEKLLDSDFLSKNYQKELLKEMMNPDWDREYGEGKIHWDGAPNDGKDRGPNEYFCPNGWKRYAFNHGTPAEFDKKFKGWSVCYHGTSNMAIGGILSHSIVTGWDTFFSPSIEYSAHPRYSTPRKMKDGKFVQMIFQCRIDPTAMHKWPETLGVGRKKQIDKNFDFDYQHCQCGNPYECPVKGHNEMEWWLQGTGEGKYEIVGLMIRISDNPKNLKESDWWKVAGCKNHLNWENS